MRALWTGDAQTITAADGSATYSKDELIAALATLIQQFHPELISTLDSSGFNGTGQDPSGINITFLNDRLHCDFYDHSDHYYSAIFARAAESAYRRPHQFQRYRAYNMANEDPNVFGQDFAKKEAVFQAYAEHDTAIGPPTTSNHPPFCTANPGRFASTTIGRRGSTG